MKHLPLEILLLSAAHVIRAQRGAFERDATLPCVGSVKDLNVDGLSPGDVYNQLQGPCRLTVGGLPAPSCKCNLPVYNLYMASAVCQQDSPTSWAEWAQSNFCNASDPPATIPYGTGAITIPKWAYTNLAEGQFDLASALQKARGWSPIQIAVPIIVGLGVALLAAILFYFYRRRRQGTSVGRQRKDPAWQEAHLHAPRRFFGLVPERFTVRSRTSREPQWEIDDNAVLDEELGRVRSSSPKSRHSRMESTTSLLSSAGSRRSARPRSFFDTLASKISGLSLHKKYQSGTTKGPDYKRVHVVPRPADPRFALDGGDPPTPAAPGPPTFEDALERQSTLPSVLDIRAPSGAGSRTGARRGDSLGTDDGAPRTVFQSEYSLGTTDLVTPVSPSGSDGAQLRDPSAAHHVSVVNPRSPLIQSAFDVRPPALNRSMYIDRQESTDTLAHALYPREPSYEY
ncbi:hypothetical protein PsYK624_061700 [Phanerochaete sordida]|uniref:Extracellular membrane protein CFEM domain-containing protein n=1 Tax=Phanerochaete sordida TaxID=48140 RepID=A0A9P3G8K3_9APHY|nr:hypothetical protein PsYK624_061700 [Phanerochaete sordida]